MHQYQWHRVEHVGHWPFSGIHIRQQRECVLKGGHSLILMLTDLPPNSIATLHSCISPLPVHVAVLPEGVWSGDMTVPHSSSVKSVLNCTGCIDTSRTHVKWVGDRMTVEVLNNVSSGCSQTGTITRTVTGTAPAVHMRPTLSSAPALLSHAVNKSARCYPGC